MKRENKIALIIFLALIIGMFLCFYFFNDFLNGRGEEYPVANLVLSIVCMIATASVPLVYLIAMIIRYPKMQEADKRLSCFIFGSVAGALITFLLMK